MGEVMLPTPAGQLEFQPDDNVIRPAVAARGQWEPEEARLIARLLKARSGVFLDLGAHVGYHTAVQLAWNPELFALAVEANTKTFRLLWRNIRRWYPQRVDAVLGAAWHDPESVLQLEQAEPGNGGDWRAINRVTDGTAVPVVVVDKLLSTLMNETDREHTFPRRVSVIKSDLQGRDHIALRGAWGTLLHDRPDVIVEFCPRMIEDAPPAGDWDPTPEEILRWYQECHYGVRFVDGTMSPDPVSTVRTASFMPGGDLTLWLQPIERLRREAYA